MGAKEKVHSALCENFATYKVIPELEKLMSTVNTYFKKPESEQKINLLLDVFKYVSFILDCFGLEYGKNEDSTDNVAPLMDIFANYRDEVKKAAKNNETSFKEILGLSDK